MTKKKLPKAILGSAANARKAQPALHTDPLKPTAAVTPASDVSSPSAVRQRALAIKMVKRYALWCGISALIPVPFVDMAAVGGLQINMLQRISQIYGVSFSENAGKAIIASLAGVMIPTTSGIGAASILKSVPVAGTIASGLAMPALSAGATYAIGMAFIEHLVSGGTLLDFKLGNNRLMPKRIP